MKRSKRLSAVWAMLLSCFLLTGCIANVGEVVINEDGSGSCTLYARYTEETYNYVMEIARMTP